MRRWLCRSGGRSRRRTAAQLGPLLGPVAVSLAVAGCFSVKTEHKVEPIQITMDINVKLERELEDAFSGLDARAREIAEEKQEESP